MFCRWTQSTTRFFNALKATAADVDESSLPHQAARFAKRPREIRFDHAGTSAEASDLEHGTEDHDRFGHVVQQGAGDDRGALAVWRRNGAGRSRDSSAEHCPFDGRIRGRLGARTTELFEHVLPDSIRRDLARSRPELVATARFFELVEVEFCTPRYDDFPALNLARRAGETGGTLPAVMNAANEVAVSAFLDRQSEVPANLADC